jgi:uncharacterized delta-60 repeat protein
MPVVETSRRQQKAVLWAASRHDEFGQPTVDSPAEVDVRWNTNRRESLDAQGNVIALDADAVVDRRIAVGSIMWLGKLVDWYSTDVNNNDSELMQVKTYSETPDLKNRFARRTVGLMRHRDELPALTSPRLGYATLAGAYEGYWQAVAVQSDGKIVVAGNLTATNDIILARYDARGVLDPLFGTAGLVTVDFGGVVDNVSFKIVIQPDDGKIVVGVLGDDYTVARYLPSGVLDPSFGSGGKAVVSFGTSDGAACVALQSDGKIVSTGYATVGGVSVGATTRHTSAGVLDASFSGDGKATTVFGAFTTQLAGIVVQAVGVNSGKSVVAGFTLSPSSYFNYILSRFNADGSLDTSFDTDGVVLTDFGYDNGAYGVALQADDNIVAAGQGGPGGIWRFNIVRWSANGALDTGFGTAGQAIVTPVEGFAYGVVVQADGKIVAAGNEQAPANVSLVVRLDSRGVLDDSFGAGGKVYVSGDAAWAVALQNDGKLVIGSGNFFSAGPLVLTRLLPDGRLDASFGDLAS